MRTPVCFYYIFTLLFLEHASLHPAEVGLCLRTLSAQEMVIRALKQTNSCSVEAAIEYISKMSYQDPARPINAGMKAPCRCLSLGTPWLGPRSFTLGVRGNLLLHEIDGPCLLRLVSVFRSHV